MGEDIEDTSSTTSTTSPTSPTFNSCIDDAVDTEAKIDSLLRHTASLKDDSIPIWSLSAADTRKILCWAQRGCKSYLDWAIDVQNPKNPKNPKHAKGVSEDG